MVCECAFLQLTLNDVLTFICPMRFLVARSFIPLSTCLFMKCEAFSVSNLLKRLVKTNTKIKIEVSFGTDDEKCDWKLEKFYDDRGLFALTNQLIRLFAVVFLDQDSSIVASGQEFCLRFLSISESNSASNCSTSAFLRFSSCELKNSIFASEPLTVPLIIPTLPSGFNPEQQTFPKIYYTKTLSYPCRVSLSTTGSTSYSKSTMLNIIGKSSKNRNKNLPKNFAKPENDMVFIRNYEKLAVALVFAPFQVCHWNLWQL